MCEELQGGEAESPQTVFRPQENHRRRGYA